MIGLCRGQLGEPEVSAKAYRRALLIDPTFKVTLPPLQNELGFSLISQKYSWLEAFAPELILKYQYIIAVLTTVSSVRDVTGGVHESWFVAERLG